VRNPPSADHQRRCHVVLEIPFVVWRYDAELLILSLSFERTRCPRAA
jgi:hypothetical protein